MRLTYRPLIAAVFMREQYISSKNHFIEIHFIEKKSPKTHFTESSFHRKIHFIEKSFHRKSLRRKSFHRKMLPKTHFTERSFHRKIHFIEKSFRRKSLRRKSFHRKKSSKTHFAESSFHRKTHFAENSFHRKFISSKKSPKSFSLIFNRYIDIKDCESSRKAVTHHKDCICRPTSISFSK